VEQLRQQAPAPAVAPRPQVVEPINGELRHGLAQNRVDLARAWREAGRFEDKCELEMLGSNRHGLCGAECFSILIRSTPLPKGIKLSNGVVKFNGQQDPRIWLDDFITGVTISGGSRDNALQLLSLHLKDTQGHGSIILPQISSALGRNFGRPSSRTFEAPHDDQRRSKNCIYAFRR
jgi:hypothetical protein